MLQFTSGAVYVSRSLRILESSPFHVANSCVIKRSQGQSAWRGELRREARRVMGEKSNSSAALRTKILSASSTKYASDRAPCLGSALWPLLRCRHLSLSLSVCAWRSRSISTPSAQADQEPLTNGKARRSNPRMRTEL